MDALLTVLLKIVLVTAIVLDITSQKQTVNVKLYVEIILQQACNNVMMEIQLVMMDALQYVKIRIVPKVVYVEVILCHTLMDHVQRLVEMELLLENSNVTIVML